MDIVWQSIYLPVDTFPNAAAAMQDALGQQGYQRYDPFTGGTGTPVGFKEFFKSFVAPPVDGYCRVLVETGPHIELFQQALQSVELTLSEHAPIVCPWTHGQEESGVEVLIQRRADEDNLITIMRDKTGEDLDRAMRGEMPTMVEKSSAGMLPDDIQRLAEKGNVDPAKAGKMMERITSQLFGKLDRASGGEASSMQDQARAMAMGGNRMDWNSPAGQRLRAMATVLTFPANWREPDFGAVRDAYQAARMLRKNPRAMLMVDEQSALKAVPNANDYEAVYAGK